MELTTIRLTLLVLGVVTAIAAVGGEENTVAYPLAPSSLAEPQPTEAPSSTNGQGVTSQTEQWLQLQARGRAASRTPQQATALERELSYQRLLNSYGYPIPEFFDQDASGEVSR